MKHGKFEQDINKIKKKMRRINTCVIKTKLYSMKFSFTFSATFFENAFVSMQYHDSALESAISIDVNGENRCYSDENKGRNWVKSKKSDLAELQKVISHIHTVRLLILVDSILQNSFQGLGLFFPRTIRNLREFCAHM